MVSATVSANENGRLATAVMCGFAEKKLEAPPGFEPGMEVLQTSALPLGDGAVRVWTVV
jgi:hypothetical protein